MTGEELANLMMSKIASSESRQKTFNIFFVADKKSRSLLCTLVTSTNNATVSVADGLIGTSVPFLQSILVEYRHGASEVLHSVWTIVLFTRLITLIRTISIHVATLWKNHS